LATKKGGNMPKPETVDEYIAGLEGWQAEVVSSVREIIREAAPEATESIKWAQPVYEDHGPFCYVKAFKNHVNFGFWRGSELPDPEGIIVSSGKKMGHVKLTGVEDLQPDLFAEYVRAAVDLNRRLGDPTKG
jgi:hypothetical protein